MSKHACVEKEADNLNVLDIEAAVLTDEIEEVLTHDPWGTHFVAVGSRLTKSRFADLFCLPLRARAALRNARQDGDHSSH